MWSNSFNYTCMCQNAMSYTLNTNILYLKYKYTVSSISSKARRRVLFPFALYACHYRIILPITEACDKELHVDYKIK